jgi:hypothetical protein
MQMLMRKIWMSAAALLLITGAAFAQDKKGKTTAQKGKDEKACAQTAKGKACCMQPSKTLALRAAAAKPKK